MILKLINRLRSVNAYNNGKSENLPSPAELIIEITNRCNLSCIMCPRVSMKRPQGIMDVELFKNIIDQIKNSVELVYISGGLGEPLLHPNLSEMVRYCRDNNVKVGISTNATLLTPEKVAKLLEHPPNLILLSLDGATKEMHERIRVGSNFESTMQNAEHFLSEKTRRHCRDLYAVVQMVYMPENQGERKYFYRKWKGNPGVNEVRLKKYLHLQGAKCTPDISEKLKQCENKSCFLPWRQLSVAWNGDVALCCRDYDFLYPVGNLKKSSVKDLWNSKRMSTARCLLASGKKNSITLCRACLNIRTSFIAKLAAICFDAYTIRKLLPIVEKIVIKTGIKMLDYE